MNKFFILIFFISLFINNCKSQIHKKIFEKNNNLELSSNDRILSIDTSIIKIGYDSLVATKYFEFIYLRDLSFDNGKLKINMPLSTFKKNFSNITFESKRIEDIEAEDGFWNEPRYYYNGENYVVSDALFNEKQKKILSICVKNKKSIIDKIDLKVGDSITKIPKYFNYAFKYIRDELDKSIKNKQPNFGNERYVDISIYRDRDTRSDYWLRFVCDIISKKIIRIEVEH
jgi:hypothetical protein